MKRVQHERNGVRLVGLPEHEEEKILDVNELHGTVELQ